MSKIKSKQISDISSTITSIINATSINALLDVNTVTTTPTNGQALAWNGSNWTPTTISGGGGGSSLNFHVNVTSNNTVLTLTDAETFVLVKNGSTAFNVYLPPISGKNTKKVHIKRLGTAYVTVNVNSSDTGKFIDFSGTTSFVLSITGTTLTLVANEADGAWYIM